MIFGFRLETINHTRRSTFSSLLLLRLLQAPHVQQALHPRPPGIRMTMFAATQGTNGRAQGRAAGQGSDARPLAEAAGGGGGGVAGGGGVGVSERR